MSNLKRKTLFSLILSLSVAGCTKLDDYMLGKDNTPTPQTLAPVATKTKLKEKWTVAIGSGQKNKTAYLKLKPVIRGNVVYTADNNGIIEAVDKATGKILWTKQLTTGVVSGPSIGQDHLVVSTDSSSLVALKQSNGEEIWQAKVSGDVLGQPAIAQNKVIAKTIDGNLYAFDLKSGNKLWVSDHGAPSLILKASSSPVIMNDSTALVGYSDGKMDAVDIQTGQVLWQRSIAFANGSSDVERLVDIDADPIVQGNIALLASYQGYIGALSLTDGQFVWRKPASTFTNIAVKGKTLFMTDSQDIIWAINKNNGQVEWKQDALKARGLTEPVLMENYVVVGDKTGILHVLSTQTGEFISRAELGSAIHVAPSVSGNNIYVMTANGKLSHFTVG
ncbi:PQQ (pyrrolo-quinoline quinone) enzyme repeat protein [Legionella beliardensis]|uniref:Outer membrane protein assembly factor BamB n=1 Tax=Legionella beliardensis TaxID=91822 RepID=A0A378I344_9GAMM|nr:outer membrane protein assembly factor BamB [Legionella beliardensis]STX29125.1 PQQ (pyrrolo-quinoline quinone) enzyme repeat protein [Legionella beliardensis]